MKTLRLFPAVAPLVFGLTLGAVACGGAEAGSSNEGDSSNSVRSSDDAGSSTDGAAFSFGSYSDCQWLLTGGTFERSSSPAALTLGPICGASGCGASSVVASFQSGQTTATVTLRATSDSSATLSGSGQGFAGQWGFCGGGVDQLDGGGIAVSDPGPAEATLSVTSAELAIDQGVAFLVLEGPVVDVQGSPGCSPDTPPSAPLSALLVCDVSSGNGAGNPPAPTAPKSSRFEAGTYDCTSTAASVVSFHGVEDHSTIAGSGTLTLAANGPSLEAVYSGDTNAAGTLDFVATSDSSANAVPAQSLTVGCAEIDPSTGPTNASTPAAVTAGALTTDGTSLYVTFLSKASGGTCASLTATTALVCTPRG